MRINSEEKSLLLGELILPFNSRHILEGLLSREANRKAEFVSLRKTGGKTLQFTHTLKEIVKLVSLNVFYCSENQIQANG